MILRNQELETDGVRFVKQRHVSDVLDWMQNIYQGAEKNGMKTIR